MFVSAAMEKKQNKTYSSINCQGNTELMNRLLFSVPGIQSNIAKYTEKPNLFDITVGSFCGNGFLNLI